MIASGRQVLAVGRKVVQFAPRPAVGAREQAGLVDNGAGVAAVADPTTGVERLDLEQMQLAIHAEIAGAGDDARIDRRGCRVLDLDPNPDRELTGL